MKIKKSYTKTEVLEGALIGFEFEFYSNMDSIEETARSMASYVKKRIVIPLALSSLDEPKPLYHSPLEPSADIFKLEPDYSGGKNMCELVTGPMKYRDARNVLIKVFDWIKSNGYTNERCSIHVNLSIDPSIIPTTVKIPQMDVVKFIISFDEALVYKEFPKREFSVYARSIKKIRPNKIFYYTPSLEEFSKSTMSLPVNDKYFGVNFLKREKGYLEYRYLGGADYEKKTRKILDLADYFIIHLYETLNFNGSFSETERAKFKKMMQDQENIYKAFIKHEDFKKRFPKIEVTLDMNDDELVLSGVWPILRDKLFSVITTGGMKSGKFNYDSEVGKFQLRDTKLKDCYLQDVELVECEMEGVFDRCIFYSCTIKNSRVSYSQAMKDNKFIGSKMADTPLHISNECEDCFIENKRDIINCKVVGGVIRNGEIGKLANISKETMIVELIEPSESPGSFKENDGEKKKEEKKAKK